AYGWKDTTSWMAGSWPCKTGANWKTLVLPLPWPPRRILIHFPAKPSSPITDVSAPASVETGINRVHPVSELVLRSGAIGDASTVPSLTGYGMTAATPPCIRAERGYLPYN